MKRIFVLFVILVSAGVMACRTAPVIEDQVALYVPPEPVPVDTTIIDGSIGSEITPRELIIEVRSDFLEEALQEGTDVAQFIGNLPEGLTAEAKRAEKGDRTIVITIEGIPRETKQEPVALVEGFEGTFKSAYLFDIAAAAAHLTLHPDTSREPWRHNENTQSISGIQGKTIVPKDIQITFTDAALKEAIVKDRSVDWITNLPEGLRAIVRKAEAHATELTITVFGTSAVTKDEPVLITIPAELVDRTTDLKVEPNEDVRYEISNVQISPIIIGGAQGKEITPRDVVINLPGTSVRTAIANGTSLSWIHNLPAGLTATAKAAAAGDRFVTITVAGTPKETKREPLFVSVPDSVLVNGIELIWTPIEAVRFDIGTLESYNYSTINSNTFDPEWRGNPDSSANFPTIPVIKDFEGVGIVTVTTQLVEALGPDNQYHWTGEFITYNKLMVEARKINAHGIINITIDSEDKISNTRTITYLEDNHVYTPEEQAKIRSRLLREVTIDGVKYLEETSRVVTRTYTGTALAIKYTTGIDFFEVEQLKTEAVKAEAAKAEAEAAKAKAEADAEWAKADAIRAETEARQAAQATQATQNPVLLQSQPIETAVPRK